MSAVVATHNSSDSSKSLAKKPNKQILKLFRKNKPAPLISHQQQQHQLGSGFTTTVAANSMPQGDPYDPYLHSAHVSIVPPPPFSIVHNIARKAPLSPNNYYPSPSSSTKQRLPKGSNKHNHRQRSKSVGGRDPHSFSSSSSTTSRLLEEREQALNKLCGNSPLTSLTDSLPLLSPTYSNSSSISTSNSHYSGGSSNNSKQKTATFARQQLPPIPPMPQLQQSNGHNKYNNCSSNSSGIRKFASAHDLRKATKIHQDKVRKRAQEEPLPSFHLNHLTVKKPALPIDRTYHVKANINNSSSKSNSTCKDDDDDDIPIGYLAQPTPTMSPNSISAPPLTSTRDKRIENNNSASVNDSKITIADRYKVKVRKQLKTRREEDDDDEIPISFLTLKNSNSN